LLAKLRKWEAIRNSTNMHFIVRQRWCQTNRDELSSSKKM